MKHKRLVVGVTLLALVAAFAVSSASQSNTQLDLKQRQPHMYEALQHLKEAEKQLEEAEQNKGGHRDSAIDLVKKAINEVNAGIQYADTHPNEKKSKPVKH